MTQQIQIKKGSGYLFDIPQIGDQITVSGIHYTVTNISRTYFKYNGMSVGVGADSGYLYTFDLAPAKSPKDVNVLLAW